MTRKRRPILQDADCGYMRVSKIDVDSYADRDTALRELIAVRTKELQEAAQKAGHALPDEHIYMDMDISGTSIEQRAGFLQMIQDAKSGRFSRIWFRSLSRIFRNLMEQTICLNDLRKAGVEIISLAEPSTGDEVTDNLIVNVLGSINEYQAKQTGQTIKKNNRGIASMGRYIGSKAPLGYRYDPETKRLLIDENRRDDVVCVFQTYAQERTFCKTAIALNAMGVTTRDGALWRHDKVKDTVSSPVYRGKVKYDGEVWPGQHEVFVPQMLISQADALLSQNATYTAPARPQESHTYSGLLVCGLCGSPMRGQPNRWRKTPYYYWVCSAKKDTGVCSMPSYRTEELDRFVLEGIEMALSHELATLSDYTMPDMETAVTRDSTKRQSAIQAKMTMLTTEYTDGFLPQAQYRTMMAQLQAQLMELEKIEPAKPRRITAKDVKAFRRRFQEEWMDASEVERHRFLQSVCPKIQVHLDKLILHTIFSLGNVTVPTHMFEQVGTVEESCPGRNDTESNSPCRFAPGRTGGSETPRWVLSVKGRQVRFGT